MTPPVVDYYKHAGVWTSFDGSDVIIPPPPGTFPLFGASIGTNFATTQSTFGGVAAARVFDDGAQNNVLSGSTNVVVVHSVNGGNYTTAWWDSKLASWPSGRILHQVYHHEPENDNLSPTDITDYFNVYVDMRERWVLAGRPANIKIAQILISDTSSTKAKTDVWRPPLTTLAGDRVLDYRGWDTYDAGYKNNAWMDPATRFNQFQARKAEDLVPWGVTENGSALGPLRTVDWAKRTAWYTKWISQATAANIPIWLAWDSKANKSLSQKGMSNLIPTYGDVPSSDFRVWTSPEMRGIAPGSQAGNIIFGEDASHTEARDALAAACATSRARNGIAYP